MKRGKPLRRRAPLRNTPLEAQDRPLRRLKHRKQRGPKATGPGRAYEPIPADAWRWAYVRAGGLCECGCGRRAEQLHHVFPRQRFPELNMEPDNWLMLAERCHSRHEQAVARLPRRVVARAERLATTGPRVGYLERAYR